MSISIDKAYVAYLSPRLKLFSQKSEFLWKFRCPLCGDSKKNPHKTRGYIYRKDNRDSLSFQCHNCGENFPFRKFLERVDTGLYKQYKLESYIEGGKQMDIDTNFTAIISENKQTLNTITLPKIVDLPTDHFARRFLVDRKIPEQFLSDLYYADDYKAFVEEQLPDNDHEIKENDKRIVIPFYDENKRLVGVQGRTVLNSPIKYITVKFDKSAKKIWGLERINLDKTIYVVEGPFDAMFLWNTVATMDGSLSRIIAQLGPRDYVLVFDNEPRNAAVIHQMEEAIKMGYKIFVWPNDIASKDVNDLILTGSSGAIVQNIIDTHTYQGLRATLELNIWKKT